ncbi:MAG: hypothetical protein A2Y31_05875 [Spirochaetes bacterium GWC2_52_13]|nr:MAG: hypothetical protein A2Y31_05875 [Spirochaetes bacterium GWC2_52_13]
MYRYGESLLLIISKTVGKNRDIYCKKPNEFKELYKYYLKREQVIGNLAPNYVTSYFLTWEKPVDTSLSDGARCGTPSTVIHMSRRESKTWLQPKDENLTEGIPPFTVA